MIEWDQKKLDDFINQKNTGLVYLYTPFCGTCQVAGKMLSIVEEVIPGLPIGKVNLNYMNELAEKWMVESVPCLVFMENGEVIEKVYAFHSVPFLVEKIKTIIKE